MAQLKNEFTWSFSRDRLFRECRRSYFYYYYLSWGGWEKNTDALTRKAYVLKNVRALDAWIGDVIHQVIKWILESISSGVTIDRDQARAKAKKLLFLTWEQSRSRQWEKSPRNNLNLFEHYYKREPSREVLAPKLEKVTKSLEGFYSCGLLELLSSLNKEAFIRVDELDSFSFDGIKVFAIPDFALHDRGYTLYDWKTGKRSDKDIWQLSLYIFYAMAKWKAKKSQIRIVPVYLIDPCVSLDPITPHDIDAVKTYMRESVDAMKSVLSDVATNQAVIDSFPRTLDTWRCKNCRFQEICR